MMLRATSSVEMPASAAAYRYLQQQFHCNGAFHYIHPLVEFGIK